MIDPYRSESPLPIERAFHPFGFTVIVHTNHSAVAAAAEESWREFKPLFPSAPLDLYIAVDAAACGNAPPEPVFRAQKHLVSIVADAGNFAVCDPRQRMAHACLTQAVVEDRAWFRWFFLEAMAYILLAQLHLTGLHAACVAIDGRGLLLCGDSGMGKTSLAFACARAGLTYVSDDVTELVRGNGWPTLVGNPFRLRFRPSAAELFPELAGRPETLRAFGKPTIEARAEEFGFKSALHCTPAAVLFTRREQTESPQLYPLAAEDAYSRLVDLIPIYDRRVYQEMKDSVRELVGAAPAYEFVYSGLDAAVEKLQRILEPAHVAVARS